MSPVDSQPLGKRTRSNTQHQSRLTDKEVNEVTTTLREVSVTEA